MSPAASDPSAAVLASALSRTFGPLTAVDGVDLEVTTGELFSLLGSNKRIGMLGEVARQFVHLYEQMQGQDVARVVTAVPLTAELEKKILEKLKQITGKEVTVENEVDPSLIGGFILRVGDLEYNASIASKLANLKREFIHS